MQYVAKSHVRKLIDMIICYQPVEEETSYNSGNNNNNNVKCASDQIQISWYNLQSAK